MNADYVTFGALSDFLQEFAAGFLASQELLRVTTQSKRFCYVSGNDSYRINIIFEGPVQIANLRSHDASDVDRKLGSLGYTLGSI